MPVATASDVARCFIYLSSRGQEPDPLTPLRLQKLLYYAQGWSLAYHNRPLFDSPIEGWIKGPVVPEIYHEYKNLGDGTIPACDYSSVSLGEKDRTFVESIWEGYKQYSASALIAKTHREAPWLESRQGLERNERGDVELSHESLQSFFKSELDKQQISGFEPENIRAA